MQVAYLVSNLDESIEHWARLGVGPFFVYRNIPYEHRVYRGEKATFEIAAAFAYFGDLQLELVERLNDAPSIYKEFEKQQGHGVQHLGILSPDFDHDSNMLQAAGFEEIQRMVSAVGVETVFFGRSDNLGSSIELIRADAQVVEGFAQMKEAAADWDSSMPLIFEI